uniref:Reverse transcriptase domain-containing protein n=1 Tax=Glossina palpalis gambiensis TaxID=67801 RepID=A0A1B0AR85_9MUSC
MKINIYAQHWLCHSLGLSKAFDRVDHGKMLQKLSSEFIFLSTLCSHIKPYISSRRQFVSFKHRRSHIRHVRSGVGHGSVLGPLLCSVYLNNFFSVVESTVYALADDIQSLFYGTQSRDALQLFIHESLDQLERWMKSNSMLLNISKSKIMRFGTMHLRDMRFQLRGNELEFVDKLKMLNVIIDRKFNCSHYIGDIC